MEFLELLAPARNADIGIAAIDCGADAVYIAGPAFGARQAAGNSMKDIRRLTEYAHRFGARIFLTLNTILFDDELAEAERLLAEAKDAGVDAIIAQDLAVWQMTDLPVHASTQCAVRTPEKAGFYEGLGASRIVLEREMSLEQIRSVRSAVGCELEFFVHGALCVCYSGQCYMSEQISGRSANRGECIQACRSLYDLVDDSGRVLARNKALLSLKDYNLVDRLADLADAGICSFKIEGRLKSVSYVRNVVRAYSSALDKLVAANPENYRRVSFGRCEGGFAPDLGKTFNRGYTQLFLDGKRSGRWSSMDAPKSIGEEVGTVVSVAPASGSARGFKSGSPAMGRREAMGDIIVTVRLRDQSVRLQNGDGFSFMAKGRGEIVGFRGDVCQGSRIICRNVQGLYPGARLYRNLSAAFEKELESNLPSRTIPVEVDVAVRSDKQRYSLKIKAQSQDGRVVELEREAGTQVAENAERMRSLFSAQISKASGIYSFTLRSLDAPGGALPFLPASALNAIRRDVAAAFEGIPCKAVPLPANPGRRMSDASKVLDFQDNSSDDVRLTYKANVTNHLARETYLSLGAASVDNAFELSHRPDAELMRTKYCIRHELGLCPVHPNARELRPASGLATSPATTSPEPSSAARLFLTNNGKRYPLAFDCSRCEMIVKADRK